DRWFTIDVAGGGVDRPAVYSFVLQPGAADQNAVHFISKEASPMLRPYLLVQVVAVDKDGDGAPDGPDCNDSDQGVHPGAVEKCNQVDDNCDGRIDEGCAAPPVDAGAPPR